MSAKFASVSQPHDYKMIVEEDVTIAPKSG